MNKTITIISPELTLCDSYDKAGAELTTKIESGIISGRYTLDAMDATNGFIEYHNLLQENNVFKAQTFNGCYHSINDIVNMQCPECGKKSLQFGEWEAFETLCDHCSDPNKTPPLRPTLVCTNEDCQAFEKGYWSEEELAWYGVRDGKYTKVRCHDIFQKTDMKTMRYENFEYKNGKHIGANKISKIVKFWDDYTYDGCWKLKATIKDLLKTGKINKKPRRY